MIIRPERLLLIDLCFDRCDPAALPDERIAPLAELTARLNVESQVLSRLGPHQQRLGTGAARWLTGLRQRVAEIAVTNLLRDEELAEALGRLRARGIDLLLLKGSALRAAQPGLAGRFQCDVDVLLRRRDLEAAEALLTAMGFRLDESFQCRAGLLRNHFHFAYERRGAVVELHWDVDTSSPDGFVDRLWQESRELDLDGSTVRVPSPEHQLLFGCLHLSRHAFLGGLRWLADLGAQLPVSGEVGERFAAEAQAWPRRAVWSPLWLLGLYGAPGAAQLAMPSPASPLERSLLRRVLTAVLLTEPWLGLPAWRAAKAVELWLFSQRPFPAVLREVSTRGIFRKLRGWAGDLAC
ncbi:MAG TPA: nucleotidyltransferase family protein [Thermoanaerobaculia bacterium]|nr:nucleotidyltransferase family protein [Thermoanaerobaculia bacterium]